MQQHEEARIAQEQAIAIRIARSEEEKIEEYYDTSDQGNIGITKDQHTKKVLIGLGTENKRVKKRVYHFKD